MLTTDDLRFFSAVARASSLASAARALNVSPPAVTQRLRALEERLRVHLIDRSGRHLTLTDEGELLAERGRQVLENLGELEDALADRRGLVRGHLRVIAPLGFGRRYAAPVVAAFQAEHPEMTLDLVLSDRLGGTPTGSGWDLAIHVGEMEHTAPGLIMRNLAPNERWACAAPSYLSRRGTPETPETPGALRAHACIALRENDEDVTLWRFRPTGAVHEERVRIEPHLASNDGEVVRNWSLAGRGIIVRSEWDLIDDVRAGRLVRLLADYALPPAPVVALLGARRQARAVRTSRFLDALQRSLEPVPWRRGVLSREGLSKG